MQVCWHWHHVGVAAHALWSFIDLSRSGRWERLFGQLRRSGVFPLTLKIGHCDNSHYVDIILEHSERIRVLEVSGEARHIHRLLNELPNSNFPLLSSLALNPNRKREEISAGFVATLPAAIVDGGIPKLRELTLSDINLPWMSVHSLESLSLSNSNDSVQPSIPNLESMLAMLEACPQLRTLRLENIRPPELDFNLARTIHLPALMYIRLRDPVIQCRALLTQLDFPPSARLHVFATGVRVGADIRELLVPISRRLRHPGATRAPLLRIDCSGSAGTAPAYCMISTYLDIDPPDLLDRSLPVLSLNSHPINENSMRQILSKIIKALSFQHITHLDGRLAPYLTPVSWRTVLKLLPSLHTAYVQTLLGMIGQFLRALVEVEDLDPERQKYPRIHRLHILAAVLDEENDMPATLTLLRSYLQLCHGLGAPLPILEIDERHFCLSPYEAELEEMFFLVGGADDPQR
ncbi:F-box domain-containing protein [Mycena venus]|uniref:F-box domain-containing protein n=1 Tax=Mycena venus TaxID=2733690 RepID=A0A8H6X588_9AGAR|nr:F-box domain-containing protein [Mycena venus]